jgi:hypothetical protein
VRQATPTPAATSTSRSKRRSWTVGSYVAAAWRVSTREVYALLTVYQALIRIAGDTATARPGPNMDRISFTVLLQTTGDLVTTANGILPTGPITLIGAIGRAALRGLLPAWRRPRVKARTRKNPTSKYGPDDIPQQPSPTPSTPRSRSSKRGLHPAHDAKRNGVGLSDDP